MVLTYEEKQELNILRREFDIRQKEKDLKRNKS